MGGWGYVYCLWTAGKLGREGKEHAIQLRQICIKAVIARPPFRVRFFGVHLQHGKITLLPGTVCKVGEFVAKIGDSAGRREILTIFTVQYGAQHALVLRMWLTKIEARPRPAIIGPNAGK